MDAIFVLVVVALLALSCWITVAIARLGEIE
jgi:hypothetical protein